MRDLIILIPALNEVKSLNKISKDLKAKNYKFLIADDNSNDGSSIILKKNKINYFKNRKRLGYEGNLIKGIFYILKKYKKCKYILTMDGDGEHQVGDIKKIYDITVSRKYDATIGNRKIKNRFIENFISIVFNYFYVLKDPLSGFKIYKTQYLNNHIKKVKNNLFLVDLIVNFLHDKYKVGHICIKSKKRNGNPRVGSFFSINFKMYKILTYIIIKKLLG
jgi:hypothetical protein